MDLYAVFAILEMVTFAFGCVSSGISVAQCEWCDFLFIFVDCHAKPSSCDTVLHSCIVEIVLRCLHIHVMFCRFVFHIILKSICRGIALNSTRLLILSIVRASVGVTRN